MFTIILSSLLGGGPRSKEQSKAAFQSHHRYQIRNSGFMMLDFNMDTQFFQPLVKERSNLCPKSPLAKMELVGLVCDRGGSQFINVNVTTWRT